MLASLVDVLWQLRRVDEACTLLGRQLELQSQQEDIDPIALAQGYAALGALHWERSDHEAALATYLLAERHYELALDAAAAAAAAAGDDDDDADAAAAADQQVERERAATAPCTAPCTTFPHSPCPTAPCPTAPSACTQVELATELASDYL